tara:strand:- start:11306 stop:11938 length:633 start_codon:yes stop_codon:yes gene_type:complete
MAGIATAAIIGGAASLIGGGIGAIGAGKAKRQAERKERKARKEMERMKGIYSNLDTSNPYMNMENTMEDLTINQKQAQMENQQFQQSQANILDNMKGAAGGSGVASVAQALAQQGQLAAQRSSASIGQQESANQRAAATQAGVIQGKEREGEILSRDMKRDQTSTLLGMAQQETAAYGQQAAQAQQAKWDSISSGISGVADSATSYMGQQ